MDPRRRFSSRVEDYVRYRPGYPAEVADFLRTRCGCGTSSAVADIGSGTGIFSRLLLSCGAIVHGVEPNDEMRRAAEAQLSHNRRFVSVAGSAEETTLPDRSVDLVTAAQAFHWFDLEKTRREFSRILTEQGWVVLIWNARVTDATEFLAEYDQFLLAFGTDYAAVNHVNVEREKTDRFFAPNGFEATSFPNEQVLDFEGLQGRVLSSSYMPDAGSPIYGEMVAGLAKLFDRYQQNGTVRLLYRTNVYAGKL